MRASTARLSHRKHFWKLTAFFNRRHQPGCDLPRCVVALMLYSDATHIAQFEQAKLCPIYTYFGIGSKFVRGRPSANAGYNVASLPSVSFSQCCFIIISLSIWLSFQTRSISF